MEKGMDRNLRLAPTNSAGWRPWIRAIGLGLAIASAGLTLGTASPTAAMAEVSGTSMSVPLAENAPERYVVKKGDTLWDIAGVFLRDPFFWPEIWFVNPEIANPHLIYPGDVLFLSYVDGKPRVALEQAGAVRLSPEVRSQPLRDAIRAIPYDLLMDFVGRPTLLDSDQVRDAPYVVGMRDLHMLGSTANEIYGKGLGKPGPGARFNVVNVGEELRDPDDGDLLGYMGHWAGVGEVIQTSGAVVPGRRSVFKSEREEELTHLRVLETGREIMQGDKLFPAVIEVGDDFRLAMPENEDLLGQVIAVVDGVSVAGKYQVVALNRGQRHGLRAGDALGVFYRGELVRDRYNRQNWSAFTANYDAVRLPDERSATVMVFRVYERMSYALVMQSTQVIRVGDFVANPLYGHRDAGDALMLR
jgi:LysM domain